MRATHEIVHVSRGNDALDPDNKKSLYNLLRHDNTLLVKLKKESVQKMIREGLNEEDFKQKFGHDKNYRVLRRLRHQFWNEFNIVCSNHAEFLPAHRVYSGIMTKDAFYKLMNDDFYAAFLLTQPQNVSLIQQDLLYEGYKHLEEVLEMSIYDDKGRVDNKLITHKIKIIEMLEDRLNGSVVQRTQGYVENVNRNEGTKPESEEQYLSLKEEVAKLKADLGKKDVEDAKFIEVSK